MEIYRLTRLKYAADFNGKGAAIKGGRWNSAGTEIIYCAANRSLAMAEVAVHFSMGTLPTDYVMLTIYVPDDLDILEISTDDLPANWNIFPPPTKTQLIGDRLVSDHKYVLCKIPSVVTKGDFNYLINPKHEDFLKIKVVNQESFPFDRRLFKV